MKKNFLTILTATIFILSACGNSATSVPESTNTAPPASTNLPLPTATPFPSETSQPTKPYGIINSLDTYTKLPDGYVLYGNYSWTDPNIVNGVGVTLVSIKDVNGKEISFENADVKDSNGVVIPFEGANSGMYPDLQKERLWYWAYKLRATNFATPLKLSFVVTATLPVDGGSFTFDPGPNPQLGQKWDINQDVIVNTETVHVLSAEEVGIEEGAFSFTMQSDSNIVDAAITDLAHPPVGGGGGGGGIPVAGVPFSTGFYYQIPLPQAPYTYTFTNVTILVSGDWTLTWSP